MAVILHIETSTKNCSVALAENGQRLNCLELSEANFNHAEKLHVFIEELFQKSNLTYKDIHAVACSQGPGSYTGLRIGVSAAKGFCYALDVPLIAIDTLQVLALQLKVDKGIIIPMIDARRTEVYCAEFDANYQKKSPTEAKIIDEHSFDNRKENMHFIGDGAAKFLGLFSQENIKIYPEILYPSAKEMCALAYDKYQQKDFVDVAYFEPYYLKDFVLGGK